MTLQICSNSYTYRLHEARNVVAMKNWLIKLFAMDIKLHNEITITRTLLTKPKYNNKTKQPLHLLCSQQLILTPKKFTWLRNERSFYQKKNIDGMQNI